jgi:hypothetical protein
MKDFPLRMIIIRHIRFLMTQEDILLKTNSHKNRILFILQKKNIRYLSFAKANCLYFTYDGYYMVVLAPNREKNITMLKEILNSFVKNENHILKL